MSAPWISGGRIAARVLERQLSTLLLQDFHETAATDAMHRCVRVWHSAGEVLGPASGATAVWSHLVRPCAEALGWVPGAPEVARLAGIPLRVASAQLGAAAVVLMALPWGTTQDGLQRACTRAGAERGASWVSVCNGVSWRWYDATRPYAREHLALDLTAASMDARVWQVLWLLGQAPPARAGHGRASWLTRLVSSSASSTAVAAAALREGVAEVLTTLQNRAPGDRNAHVALVFQWLFLLFAESRQLVPTWHEAYRRSYSVTGLSQEERRPGGPSVGLHESLVAVGRLGRQGGRLGNLRVNALNGPLFDAALATRGGARLPDAAVAGLLACLTGRGTGAGEPIDMAELGVEHLGSIYEHLMSASSAGASLLRKGTGAYYTPTALADLIVHRVLEPLVRDASAERILSLRVLDPAMGSGALLASALRYLVGAVEAAWVREGRGGPLDVPRRERDALPRRIAEQCLFGVDVDPRAVQVARLSMWLLSLAPDRPLTWLDAHLRCGNSLIGVSPAALLARAPVRERGGRRPTVGQLPLFDLQQWHHEAARVGPLLAALAARPTETAGDVREKSRQHASLRDDIVLATWRTRADAWCGAAMDAAREPAPVWRSVDEAIRTGTNTTSHVEACRRRWVELARAQACLHWGLEFPDVFDGGHGGFDAVVANPPWEMLRGDLGSDDDRATRRDDIRPLQRFVRESGLYRASSGHVNSYQLFVERLLQLARHGGRIGCLLPGSVLADHGAAGLRRLVFDQVLVDRVSVVDNREGLFPIHRSMRIVALSGATGASTDHLLVDDAPHLRLRRHTPASPPRLLARRLLQQAGGETEAVPHLRNGEELALLERLIAWPRLGPGGWDLRFGRELNATDDRGRLRRAPGAIPIVVVDGKHVQPFSVRPDDDGPWIDEADAASLLSEGSWRRWRLAYRDVSSPTNTRSLIAALLPPACVSTHTLFCLRTRTGLATQLYLCGMLNSVVADWFVRRYLGAHVTTKLMATLPVPRVDAGDLRRRRVVRLTLRLMRCPGDEAAAADLHATAASLYGLDATQMAVVLGDFPRLPERVRARLLPGRAPYDSSPPGGPCSS